MISGYRPIVMLFVLLAVGAADDAIACSCVPSGPPCQATWSAHAVFAGTVRSIDRTDRTDAAVERHDVVHFDVEQPYLNSAHGPIELMTSPSGGSCGYRFQAGKKYLVYAWKTETGRLSTSICSRTRALSEADEDLRYLKSIPKTGTGARVYGRINEWARDPAEAQGVDYGPVENIIVNVSGMAFSQDVATDKHGRYELAGVPLGPVSISVVTPPGFRTHTFDNVGVRDMRACVQADFIIAAEADASGTVVDQAGHPIPGVMVDAVAAELAGYQPVAFQEPVKTDERGVFRFERLPPGTYVFGVNLTKGRWKPTVGQPTFLPGTSVARDATVIELSPGDRKDVGVLRLAQR